MQRNNAPDSNNLPPGAPVWLALRHSPSDNQTLESQESAAQRLAREKQWALKRVFRGRGGGARRRCEERELRMRGMCG